MDACSAEHRPGAGVQNLLDTLGRDGGGSARENAAIVLSAVARSNTCPVTHSLGELRVRCAVRASASGAPIFPPARDIPPLADGLIDGAPAVVRQGRDSVQRGAVALAQQLVARPTGTEATCCDVEAPNCH